MKQAYNHIIAYSKNWTEEEWATICRLFDLEPAYQIERIAIGECIIEFDKTREPDISDEEWDKAKKYLEMLIVEYASIGFAGTFGLNGVLVPLRKRFEAGERTKALYDEIMRCE